MINQADFNRILSVFPLLQRADPHTVREFQQVTFRADLSAGKDVFVESDRASALALVLSGVVRVYKIGATGREITLYRFTHGESCILTANAILSYQPFPALATVEQDVAAIMIPADAFREWVRRHDLWREFFFNLLSLRLINVLTLLDDVVFRRMDARIASLLLERSHAQSSIHMTHQEIADELGSSREVISRILESFTRQGFVRSTRGTLEIVDTVQLQSLAAL